MNPKLISSHWGWPCFENALLQQRRGTKITLELKDDAKDFSKESWCRRRSCSNAGALGPVYAPQLARFYSLCYPWL